MSSATVIIVDEEEKSIQQVPSSDRKPLLKRKRAGVSASNPLLNLSTEEKSAKIDALRREIKGLSDFYKEINGNEEFQRFYDEGFTGKVDSAIAVLLEESMLPLSQLTNDVFEKLTGKFGSGNNGNGGGEVGSLASVKSKVLLIGQRVYYGILSVDADLLEDNSDSTLWCWETKDSKLLPKPLRCMLKTRLTCRGKIKERIIAVSAMIAALENPMNSLNYKQELSKASSKVCKLLSEADIRAIFTTLKDDTGSALAEKAQKHEKILVKELEKNKRHEEKVRRKMEQEKHKEDQQKEKELKRLHEEAEKEERKREKDVSKRLKKQQEEEERDQRRKEKEEAELKRQRALQKQASVMDRFLKKAKTIEASENDLSLSDTKCDSSSSKRENQIVNSVTNSMDSLLSMNSEIKAEDIWRLHLKSWSSIGHSLRLGKNVHWGIRKKPKTELVKELKLTTNQGPAHDDDMNTEMVDDGWIDLNIDTTLYQTSQKHVKHKQLLQFDKSYRPAFYGIWPNTSLVIKPCQPFAKDPELDYEIDSDEEWEEEEPGESLSDCDKDDVGESLEEGCSKDQDDNESEDGFFVPDGYLSENEGVEVDKLTSKLSNEEESTQASPEGFCNNELTHWFQQQKYLHNMTELALRKTNPLFISNFKHEKASILTDNLTSTEKRDKTCLQALSICAFRTGSVIETSNTADVKEDQEACSLNDNTTTTIVASNASILESDLAQFVSVIRSCPHGMARLVESLIDKFPCVSKTQLRNKVREIAEFLDNRWQVKKEIIEKLGLTISPVADKRSVKTKSISAFFSKRCLPPGTAGNPAEVSPQPPRKTISSTPTPSLQSSS